MKIVLTGGGTAGHVMPHISLLDELKKKFDYIYYIGSKTGIEKQIIKTYNNIKYYDIETVKLKRSLSLQNLLIPIKLIKGVLNAKKILKSIKPDVIFSKGGFVAVPVCIAAKQLKIPIVSHESDYSLGLANKIIYKKSEAMCCSFKPTCSYGKKCVCTGSAIRKTLLLGKKEDAIKEYGLNPNLPTLCITGGSLGAQKINETINACKQELLEKFNIIHLCGKGKSINENKNIQSKGKYVCLEFVSNPANIFAVCNLAICRAGSNTIFEFLALEKPMLLLPLSKKASRGDQILNSKYFKEKGFAEYILDENLTTTSLIDNIEKILKNKNFYINNMKNSNFKIGNDAILNEIMKIIK